jgi:hypothetical protein
MAAETAPGSISRSCGISGSGWQRSLVAHLNDSGDVSPSPSIAGVQATCRTTEIRTDALQKLRDIGAKGLNVSAHGRLGLIRIVPADSL